MARQMPPRWRRKKPDTPGLWALFRFPNTHSTPFMVVRVTEAMLTAPPGIEQSTVERWSADWWMPLPDVPGWDGF